jgi:TonB family protein
MAPRNARAWLAAAGLALGCGGGPRADTTPAAGGGGEAQAGETGGGGAGGEVVPPEKLDEINRQLSRKRAVMSRCLAIAVDNKELPKNSRGKVTVEIVIAPSGTADSVKIVRASLESKMLDDCVIGHIKEIAFPQLPRSFETSYTYGFEAM